MGGNAAISSSLIDSSRCLRHDVLRLDVHDLFKEPVTDDQAEGYSDIVTNPMDFGTMKHKVESGEYGTGSDAMEKFYNDLLLVFDNCALYNDEDGEVGLEAARLLGLLPESYADVCTSVVAKQAKKAAAKAD